MGKLHVGTADHLYGLHNLIGLLLEPSLTLLGNGQHGGAAEGIPGMDSQRVDIFNEAYGDDVILRIPHHFQLQLFPSENGFLHQNLSHQRCLEPPGTDHPQFVSVID